MTGLSTIPYGLPQVSTSGQLLNYAYSAHVVQSGSNGLLSASLEPLHEKHFAYVFGERVVRPFVNSLGHMWNAVTGLLSAIDDLASRVFRRFSAAHAPVAPTRKGGEANGGGDYDVHGATPGQSKMQPDGTAGTIDIHSKMYPHVVTDTIISVKTPRIYPPEALARAAEAGDLAGVREALHNGVDPNDSSGLAWSDTPLHRACIFGRAKVAAELIKHGAEVNIRCSNIWMTPLEYAIQFNHFECCKLLIQSGARVNELNRYYGSSPLAQACHEGSYEIVKLLLDSGADPNISSGITPLFHAVRFPDIVQLLLDRGADVNAQNSGGGHQKYARPLHEAALWGRAESVKILLKAGADPKARNSQNETPIELALGQLNQQITHFRTSPETSAEIIQRLGKVITLLSLGPLALDR